MVVTCAAPVGISVGCLSVAALAEALVEYLAEDKTKRPRSRAVLAEKAESLSQLRAAKAAEYEADHASRSIIVLEGGSSLHQLEQAEKKCPGSKESDDVSASPMFQEDITVEIEPPESDHPSTTASGASDSSSTPEEEDSIEEDTPPCTTLEEDPILQCASEESRVEMPVAKTGADFYAKDKDKDEKSKSNFNKVMSRVAIFEKKSNFKQPILEEDSVEGRHSTTHSTPYVTPPSTPYVSEYAETGVTDIIAQRKLFAAALNALDCPEWGVPSPMRAYPQAC
jgi:hypothetical protein